MADDFVTDPAALARLPKAGFHFQWYWFWFRQFRRDAFGRFGVRFFLRTRGANHRGYWIGPLHITVPAPWLMGPARQLHPEAFNRPDEPAREDGT